jgi:Putative transmembrane protein (PGPGW)
MSGSMISEWLQAHEHILWGLGAVSMVTFVGTLVIIPLLVVRIPTDYFLRDRHRVHAEQTRFSALRLLGRVCKNILGFIFILMGLAMLVLPGQGVITILLGIMLMNFPGKHALERRIVQQPSVLRAINWIRARANRPPLLVNPMTVPADDSHKNP